MVTFRSVMPTELKRIRSALGLTQAALANQLGVRRETVARWETGARRIAEPVARLARRLVREAKARKQREG